MMGIRGMWWTSRQDIHLGFVACCKANGHRAVVNLLVSLLYSLGSGVWDQTAAGGIAIALISEG